VLVVLRSSHVLVVEVPRLRRIPEPVGERLVEVAGKGNHRADGPGRCERGPSGADGLVEAAEPGKRQGEPEMGQREPRRMLTGTVAPIGAIVGRDHLSSQPLSLAVLAEEQ
jgi:hypothetical protein